MGILEDYLTVFFINYRLIWIYLISINMITFIFFAVDKFKAIKGKWRISEDVLLGLSFVGGSIGGLIAMNIFSHKTKKDSFKWGLKIMLILHVTIISYMVTSLI